ncbi:MAG TPA: exopolyphosphatase, partial [Clostridiales bacterium UBA8960]|nr:exopolyphosphatase [Clostridiales bacterium UBA8960]
MYKTVAIIDLGSNSIRMNIIGINDQGGYSIYEQASEMVRLSEGLSEDNLLKETPVQRTINALHYFKKLIEVNKVTEVYAL